MNLDDLRHLFRPDGDLVAMMELGLEGLTDDEYLWEPVEGCWSVRARSEQRTPPNRWLPDGNWGLDLEYPDPVPSPFTTIAWRMTHLTGSTYIGGRSCAAEDSTLDTSTRAGTSTPRHREPRLKRWTAGTMPSAS